MTNEPVVYLVRHGESQWNLERRVQGQTAHVPLTETGVAQARTAAAVLAGLPIDDIVTSDLLRARQTARIVAEPHGLTPIVDARLREQALGALEGLSLDDALRLVDGFDWSDPNRHPGGGESAREVYQRLDGVLRPLRAGDATTVLVSHGDALRVALAWLADDPPEGVPRRRIDNGAVLRVELRTGTVTELT